MSNRYWIGFDLGGTKMLATLFNDDLVKIFQLKRKTKSDNGASDPQRVTETINRMLAAWGGPKNEVAGIGIGAPGALDSASGVVINAPNLGWHNVGIGMILGSTFNLPISLVNDVDAGTYGEYCSGAASGSRCVLGVFPGTGIGGGCIYEGKILQGNSTSIMEIGHIQVVENGLRCGCGKRGCLETVASRLAIAGQAAIAACRGEAPALLAATGCDITKIKSGALATAVAAGDAVVEDIVRHAARALGQGIAIAVNLLGPDVVVLGGGLVEAMPDLYREEVAAGITPGTFSIYHGSYRIAIAQLGDDAVALGAAAHCRQVVTGHGENGAT